MPNWIGNHVYVRGPRAEIARFVSQCFRQVPDEPEDELEFYLSDVVPQTGVSELASSSATEPEHGDGEWMSSSDFQILFQGDRNLSFEFISRSDYPEDVYRRIGLIFPELTFDIAAIGGSFAVLGEIQGACAYFDEDADPERVYARVYKAPMTRLED